MERAFLEEQLAAGRSLEQIGALVGKHPSTVGYWLKKHGLAAAHHDRFSPNGRVDREHLVELIELRLTAAEIAKCLDVSVATVNYWLRKLGLRTTRGQERIGRSAARKAAVKVVRGFCRKHGPMDFRMNAGSSYKCVQCARDAVATRRRRVKQILVAEAGGCCRRCGFADHPAALEFHHVDASQKLFSLSAAGVTRSLDRARAEARKCVLLCANCHALVEAGVASV